MNQVKAPRAWHAIAAILLVRSAFQALTCQELQSLVSTKPARCHWAVSIATGHVQVRRHMYAAHLHISVVSTSSNHKHEQMVGMHPEQ
jgi:hypothetical protein